MYFSVWLVSEKGWTDQQLGFATSSAMIIVAILGPWVGRKSDGSEGKKRLLLLMTIMCIASTFLLGTFNVQISVILFVISLIGFNLGSVVYDALLISLSNEENVAASRFTGAIASLLLVPTFIVGLYGQNFVSMPETNWANGYAFSWGLIAVVTILQFIFFRKRGWI